MSKFLDLINENSPENEGFIEKLKNMGVEVKKTENGYAFTFHVSLDDNGEEEAEDAAYVARQTSGPVIDSEVENLASKANLGGRIFNTTSNQAKAAVNKRKALAGQMVNAYNKLTNKIQQALATF